MSNATGITPPPKPEDPPPKVGTEETRIHDPSDVYEWTNPQALVSDHAALIAELRPHARTNETPLATLKRLLSRPL